MKFHLKQEQFNKLKKTLLIRTVPLLTLAFIPVLIFNRSDIIVTLIMIPLFLGIMTFTLYTTIKRQRVAWKTFELRVNEFSLERIQKGFPNISISKKDIVEAVEDKTGSITLIAKSKSNSIIIPFGVENKDDLKEAILTFTTIRKAKKGSSLWKSYVGGIIALVLFFSFMMSTNFYLTMITGLIILALIAWSLVEIQRNKNIDKRVKRSSYIIIILLLVVISKIYMSWKDVLL